MFGAIFDFWYDLPFIFRILLSLGLILLSVIVFFCGRIWPWPAAVGLILLCFSGSGGNKNGYNF